ncbi:hypothetical protein [Mesobacterium pallidum]|uniref:hypothetical protein n=1 Tax=Mesobacterium pallidum TaxID=2872037 RepID=UPI001EE1DAEF|nr:hypothetical protein [Mesobacterium pallidum]
MQQQRLSQEAAAGRHVQREDYVSCTVAFIDCKKPGSHLKENYSIIGPGVTSSSEQVINLPEPHGFNIGAAAMPHGITNNLHIHFTAEVFMNFRGNWKFQWGNDGKEGSYVSGPGDIMSVPTWIFRGFQNVGADDGWLFTCLGGDNTGGVIWHPDIINEAADYGLYINSQNMLVDTSKGDPKPAPDDLITPLAKEDMAQLRRYTPEQMMQRIVTAEERDWKPAFLDQKLDGCGAQVAPVIGAGMTQNRDHQAKITNPHGFSLEWLRLAPGQRLSRFRLGEKMVLISHGGETRLSLNDDASTTVALKAWDTFSLPAGTWCEMQNMGDETVEMVVIIAGDHRKRPEFAPEVVQAAQEGGLGIDPNGYVVAAHLMPKYSFASA